MAPPNEATKPVIDGSHTDNPTGLFTLSDSKLRVNGVTLLSEVPENITFNSFSSICPTSQPPLPLFQQVQSRSHMGSFIGFAQPQPSDRLMNSLGRFTCRNFLSVFRFKTWWSTMSVGTSGSDLQMETQWVLLEVPELASYALILPLIEGKFRSALHPGRDGHVMVCAESGSTKARASAFDAIAYVHLSDNPYNLMKEAYSAARVHLNTFRLLEEKSPPPIVDKFGWCTWDAFYLTVDPIGVWHGLNEFVEGGVSPRFLIIDDGWQSVSFDGENPMEDAKNLVLGGTQMTARLYRFEECDRFKKYRGGIMLGTDAPPFDPKRPKMLIEKAIEVEQAEKALDKAEQNGVTELSEFESRIRELRHQLSAMMGGGEGGVGDENASCEAEEFGMKAFTKDLRTRFKGLDDVYVWQALCGAWGGVRPGATHLESKVVPVTVSPGLDGTMNDLAVVKIVEGGIGLVRPDQAADYFDSMHSHLAQSGVTGVKVDVIHTLEYVCEEQGGRIELAKAYYEGLTRSLVKNFKGTGLLASMQQCNDFFFLGTQQIAFGRAGDDFWFQDPSGDPMGAYWLQGVHMIHCAYNSLWMGQIIHPDWDMFQSDHLCAKFHAGSRAICGGPVYVSDSVGGHDFSLLKKIVHPDGTVPRCQHFALPTRDCLFKNPLFDGETVLKIWNLNKFGGVVGAFNCQGAGWDRGEQRIRGFAHCYKPTSGSVHMTDIEWDQKNETAAMGETEEFAVYLDQAEDLKLMTRESEPIQFTVQPSSFEIFSFVPVRKLGQDLRFAPIGLVNMFNCGGTIIEVDHRVGGEGEVAVRIEVKGGGKFLAYSSGRPRKGFLNGGEVELKWSVDGKLSLCVDWVGENGVSEVDFVF
ncbi:Stachyose synthase [Acorus calamus]|uniref:Stachyose synthase n=1 Tax=Acorus calamus TaxID=4465 RepID=A0AAV9CWV4_ACOCL|nr:Stachyose synthase [Acorus calamus]